MMKRPKGEGSGRSRETKLPYGVHKGQQILLLGEFGKKPVIDRGTVPIQAF